MNKIIIHPASVKLMLKAAPEEIKAELLAQFPNMGNGGAVAYTPPSKYNHNLIHNWTQFKWTDTMDEIQVAEAYFYKVWTWYGHDSAFRWLSTGNHSDIGMVDWINRRAKYETLQERVTKELKAESAYHPFLEPLIIDTANFILTGKRQLPIRLLHEMFNQHYTSLPDNSYGGPYPTPVIITPRGDFNELVSLSATEFFLRWVRQKGGVHDIIAAHKMLFGN